VDVATGVGALVVAMVNGTTATPVAADPSPVGSDDVGGMVPWLVTFALLVVVWCAAWRIAPGRKDTEGTRPGDAGSDADQIPPIPPPRRIRL
jgi:hypothetical protein